MTLGEWKEDKITRFPFTVEAPESHFKLGRKSVRQRRFLNWLHPRKEYYSVGLSPNCKLAFLLGEAALEIHFLDRNQVSSAEPRDSFEGEFEDAVLSNRFLVTLKRYELDVFELS